VPHVWRRRIRGRRPHRAAFGCPLAHALGQHLELLPFLAEPVPESRRERRAIPQAKGLQLLLEVFALGHHQALRREQPFDAVDDPRPIPCRGRQGAMALTAGFCLSTRNTHDTPYPLFPSDRAPEPGEPLRPSEASRLRAPVPTLDCNAGRVPADVRHPPRHSTAVEPKDLPACLVTTHDAGVIRSSTTPLGPGHLLIEAGDVPGGQRACSWPLRHPGRATQFPDRHAEVKGHKQGRPVCRGLIRLGRRWCSHRWTPACVVQHLGFAAVYGSLTPAALVCLVPLHRISYGFGATCGGRAFLL
jgi:hypothetical protein